MEQYFSGDVALHNAGVIPRSRTTWIEGCADIGKRVLQLPTDRAMGLFASSIFIKLRMVAPMALAVRKVSSRFPFWRPLSSPLGLFTKLYQGLDEEKASIRVRIGAISHGDIRGIDKEHRKFGLCGYLFFR